MTKDKLLELYEKFKEHQIDYKELKRFRFSTDEEIDIMLRSIGILEMLKIIEKIPYRFLSELKDYTEDEIEGIFKSHNLNIILELVSNESFKKIERNTKTQIINITINSESNARKILTLFKIMGETGITLRDSKKIMEIIKIMIESAGETQAYWAASLIDEAYNKNYLKYMEIISKAYNPGMAEIAYTFVRDDDILSSGITLKLIELLCKYPGDIEKDGIILQNDICDIVYNKKLLNNNRVIYYVNKILQAKDEDLVDEILEKAMNESESIQTNNQQAPQLDLDKSFWDLFTEQPKKALISLNPDLKQELIKTRVRKKQPTDN